MDLESIIVAAFLLFLNVIFIRYALGIPVIIKELNSQRLLLQKMAEKAGVSKEDIDFAVGKDLPGKKK